MIEDVRVDRYTIDKVLHQGDYTTVYRASHSVLGSKHALKVQNRDMPEEILESLLLEGRTQASVHHRNVLAVTDAIEWRDRVVLVMPYARCESLDELLGRTPKVPLRSALALFRGITRGLRAVHVQQIVHRDLKPENILLVKEEGRVVPKVSDFGLTKVLNPDEPPAPHGLSSHFRFMGTPEYMAPEQAKDPGRVDTRADLFAMGCLLYELVTGEMCFDGESGAESMYRAARSEYVAVGDLAPAAPAALGEVIDHLLRPKPEARLDSCEKLLERLDGIRD